MSSEEDRAEDHAPCMVVSRSRRVNAGNRMARLLMLERTGRNEHDDVYEAWGEDEDDEEFDIDEVASQIDIEDSSLSDSSSDKDSASESAEMDDDNQLDLHDSVQSAGKDLSTEKLYRTSKSAQHARVSKAEIEVREEEKAATRKKRKSLFQSLVYNKRFKTAVDRTSSNKLSDEDDLNSMGNKPSNSNSVQHTNDNNYQPIDLVNDNKINVKSRQLKPPIIGDSSSLLFHNSRRTSNRRLTKINRALVIERVKTKENQRNCRLDDKRRCEARNAAAQKQKEKSQEERLAEALLVESQNSTSLSHWQEAENRRLEYQRVRIQAMKKRALRGPVIRYWSGLTAPFGSIRENEPINCSIQNEATIKDSAQRAQGENGTDELSLEIKPANHLSEQGSVEISSAHEKVLQYNGNTETSTLTAPSVRLTQMSNAPTTDPCALNDEKSLLTPPPQSVLVAGQSYQREVFSHSPSEQLTSLPFNDTDSVKFDNVKVDNTSTELTTAPSVEINTVNSRGSGVVDESSICPRIDQVKNGGEQRGKDSRVARILIIMENFDNLNTAADDPATVRTSGRSSSNCSRTCSNGKKERDLTKKKDSSAYLEQQRSLVLVNNLLGYSVLPSGHNTSKALEVGSSKNSKNTTTVHPEQMQNNRNVNYPEIQPSRSALTSKFPFTAASTTNNSLLKSNSSNSRRSSHLVCTVSSNTARYRDPLTGYPYHDMLAFKCIRRLISGSCTWSETLGCFLGNSSQRKQQLALNAHNSSCINEGSFCPFGRPAKGVPVGFIIDMKDTSSSNSHSPSPAHV